MKSGTAPEIPLYPEMDSDDFRQLLSDRLADLDLRLICFPDGSAVIQQKEPSDVRH